MMLSPYAMRRSSQRNCVDARLATPAFVTSLQGLPGRRLHLAHWGANSAHACAPRLVVIGGGPAGFFCAITAARGVCADAAVTLIEGSGKVLSKVRVSGGGRCNCTNAAPPEVFPAGYPPGRGRTEMRSPLAAWSPDDMRDWLASHGVPTKVEPGGKVFPVSDQSRSVVDALVNSAQDVGVSVVTGAKVAGVERLETGRFCVQMRRGEDIACDVLCIATGSSRDGHRWAEELGHRVIPPVPSLFTFKVSDARLDGLAGVSVQDVCVQLVLPEPVDGRGSVKVGHVRSSVSRKRRRSKYSTDGLVQRGPLLVTHWGLSGPAVIQLSSFGARELHACGYRAQCLVDFVPSLSRDDKISYVKSSRGRLAQKLVHNGSPFRNAALPVRLWRSLLRYAGIDSCIKWADLSNALVERIVDVIHHSSFEVSGKGEFKEYVEWPVFYASQ